MKEFLKALLRGILVPELFLAAGVLSVVAAAFVAPPYTCAAKAEAMGLKHRYSLTTGCMVEYKPGKWIAIAQYRVID